MPSAFAEPDKRKRGAPIIVDFGDAYFLHHLINGMGYDQVLDSIEYQNKDSLRAALSYYILESSANCHAESWCRQNFASFLYPKANLARQRFSTLFVTIGSPENIRRFLLAHIQYLSAPSRLYSRRKRSSTFLSHTHFRDPLNHCFLGEKVRLFNVKQVTEDTYEMKVA